VRRVAICGTDIHAWHGRQPFFTYPRILGHELGVEVLAIGDGVSHLSPGDRCSVEPYLCRPEGRAWRRGRTNCTATTECLGVHRDGGMREQLLLPADHLHPSRALEYDQLALVETLAIGRHAVERASLHGDESAAVIGLGPIGLGVIQFLRLRGIDPIAIDISSDRLANCARLHPGIRTFAPNEAEDPREALAALLGEPPEVVFDATGNAASMERAITLPTHGGKVVFVGLVLGRISFDDPDFHRREITLYASRNALPEDFRAIIADMEAGRIDVRPWFTHRCQAVDLPGVFAEWVRPEARMLKGIVEF